MDEQRERALAVARRRRYPSEEQREARNKALERFDDWRGRCHFCGEALMGTMEELRRHSCPQFEASREASH